MHDIVQSEPCSKCRYELFELVKIDYYGNWLRCVNCQLQWTSKAYKIIHTINSSEKKSTIEKPISDNGLEEYIKQKEIAKEKIIQQFELDYIKSKKNWELEFSDLINEKEFILLSTQFVTQWFIKQGWRVPDWEQAEAISQVWENVQVVARAGSGKTATTVFRAAFLIKHCKVSPSEVLLLAFNREAAIEISNRLKDLLNKNAPHAMTFHALAYALVHPEEAIIYDDDLNGFEKSSTVQQIIDSFIQDDKWGRKIKELMLKYFREDWENIVSSGLHLSSEEMVAYRRSLPYLGLDGKHYKSHGEKRIANFLFEHDIPYNYEKNFWWNKINYKPDFTIPIQDNLIKGIVIEYLGMVGNKEYNIQIIEKRDFWRKKNDYEYIELYPEDQLDKVINTLKQYNIMGNRLTDIEIWHRIKYRAVDEFSFIVSQFISLCRKLMITPIDLVKIVKKNNSLTELQIDLIRVIWKIYQEYLISLTQNNQEDFDGLLMQAVETINSGYTRWDRKTGSGDLINLKYLFIDEYQDFSLLFYNIVVKIKEKNKKNKLFCVGDDWQAINGFAGSDLRFFDKFSDYFPNSKQYQITSNYRSAKRIVMVGNRVMQGNGTPSKAVKKEKGEVWIANVTHFTPDDLERINYNGDHITPIVIRLVYKLTKDGQKVALLSRRGNGLPWYTNYETKKGKFHSEFLKTIRDALPEELRSLVTTMDTAHSFKGKEEDAIIVLDAVERSYPLIHPNNIFFEVLGRTIKEIFLEEKRLFYVALSRAMQTMVLITEVGTESSFLPSGIMNIDINAIDPPPNTDASKLIVKVTRSGTFEIKHFLQQNKYHWNPSDKSWVKTFLTDTFNKEVILKEDWIHVASNIFISVSDEFGNLKLEISVIEGKAIILEDRLTKIT